MEGTGLRADFREDSNGLLEMGESSLGLSVGVEQVGQVVAQRGFAMAVALRNADCQGGLDEGLGRNSIESTVLLI